MHCADRVEILGPDFSRTRCAHCGGIRWPDWVEFFYPDFSGMSFTDSAGMLPARLPNLLILACNNIN